MVPGGSCFSDSLRADLCPHLGLSWDFLGRSSWVLGGGSWSLFPSEWRSLVRAHPPPHSVTETSDRRARRRIRGHTDFPLMLQTASLVGGSGIPRMQERGLRPSEEEFWATRLLAAARGPASALLEGEIHPLPAAPRPSLWSSPLTVHRAPSLVLLRVSSACCGPLLGF